MLGRFDEATTEMNIALALQPQSSDVRVGFGFVHYLAHRYDEAIEQAELALDTAPEFFPAYVLLGLTHTQQRLLTRAIAELEEGSSLANVPWVLGCLGYVMLGFLWSSPELDSLRAEQRRIVLIRRIKTAIECNAPPVG